MDPALYKAAMTGDVGYFQSLEGGVPSNDLHKMKTPNQETVLHIATEFHQTDFAKLVMKNCPMLLLLQNSFEDTALHIAAREGHSDMVKFLLSDVPIFDSETGTDNSQTKTLNKKKDTALHCAARSGGRECVGFLVNKDPEVCTWLNNANESPLYLSIVSLFYINPEIILNNASSLEYHKGQDGLTELHAAVLIEEYPFEAIEKLVEWKKEMIGVGDDSGMTPLHYAAFHGSNTEVKLFLENDPSAIYCLNNDGQSALYVAAFNGQVNVLKMLVNFRPDCYNIVDNKGRTALHAAVLGKQHRVVEYVLKTPSLARLIPMVDNDGNTPLHLAANFWSFKIIKSFKRNDQKAQFALNNDSFTPFDVYHQHWYKQDMHQLKEDKYTEIIVAGYHLGSVKGVVAGRRLANEKLKMTNLLEPLIVGEKNLSEHKKQEEIRMGIRREDLRSEENALEVNLLVAMLVATVTFAAGFTVPGGLVNDGADEGLATLANKPTFQAFVVFNILAFSCSILAVLIHFGTSLAHHGARIYYKGVAACFTAMAILAMVLAFIFGNSIVLTKSAALSRVPYYIPASFLFLFPISRKFNTWHKLWTFGRNLDVPLYVKARLFMETRRMQRKNNKLPKFIDQYE